MRERIYLAPVLAGVVAATLTFSGCTKTTSTQPQVIASDQKAQDDSKKGNHKESAEEYARIGELLLMPESFQYADHEFDKALKEDPKNAKALLYKSVTEPMMAMRGYIARFQPLAVTDQDAKALEKFRETLKSYNMPELEDFSENPAPGKAVFNSHYDVQRFIRTELLPTILASVDRLNQVDASTPIQLNFTPARALIDPVRKSYSYTYSYNSCSNYNGNWSCNDYYDSETSEDKKLPNLYYLDQYDLKILKASMMGVADQMRLGTAFSINGEDDAMKRLKAISEIREDDGTKLTAKDTVGVLTAYPNLFTLESDNQLGAIAASTSQALKYGVELANMRATLCDQSPNSRTTANALFTPICIEATVADQMQLGLDLLAGPKSVYLGTNEQAQRVNVVIDINAILNNPPKDLKTLFPNQFDGQGNPTNYPDPTMGGLFPNGDLFSQFNLVGASHKVKVGVRSMNKAIDALKSHI